jgi:hypothetical protein
MMLSQTQQTDVARSCSSRGVCSSAASRPTRRAAVRVTARLGSVPAAVASSQLLVASANNKIQQQARGAAPRGAVRAAASGNGAAPEVFDTVVVGGGISGLVTAQALATKHADAVGSFVLTEARDRVGGNITSMAGDGYIWEEGPNSFQPNDSMLMAAVSVKMAAALGHGGLLLGGMEGGVLAVRVAWTACMAQLGARGGEQGRVEAPSSPVGGCLLVIANRPGRLRRPTSQPLPPYPVPAQLTNAQTHFYTTGHRPQSTQTQPTPTTTGTTPPPTSPPQIGRRRCRRPARLRRPQVPALCLLGQEAAPDAVRPRRLHV